MKRRMVVNDDKLLVVCPVERHVCGVLEDVVIGVAHDCIIAVSFSPFGAEALGGHVLCALSCK